MNILRRRSFWLLVLIGGPVSGALWLRSMQMPFLPSDDLKDYNIVWITAESMKPEHLGAYGYSRPTSPNIDAFAKTGTLFKHCINPSGWTSENMVSNFTGVSSFIHGVNTREKQAPPEWYLPLEQLRDRGYLVPFLQDFQQDMNFQSLGMSGGVEDRSPSRWIEMHRDSKFFLWFHILQTHLPYDPPEPHRSLFWNDNLIPNEESAERIKAVRDYMIIPRGSIEFNPSEDLAAIQALYDGDVHAMDQQFGEIVATLDRLKLREKTIVVFSADHGDEHLEHGFIGHASTARGGTLYDEILHVPLIVSLPGVIPAGRVVSQQVRGLDVMPTLFALLGLPAEPYFFGSSLVSLMSTDSESIDRTSISVTSYRGYQETDPKKVNDFIYAVRTGDWKMIKRVAPEVPDRIELYNLAEDSGEKTDLSGKNPEQLARLSRMLNDWMSDAQKKKATLDANPDPMGGDRAGNQLAAGEMFKPELLGPPAGSEISFENSSGEVVLKWSGLAALNYEVQLDVGVAPQTISTTLKVRESYLKRVFSEAYWKEYVVKYDPLRFRVRVDREGSPWSEWRTIRLK